MKATSLSQLDHTFIKYDAATGPPTKTKDITS